MKSHAEHATWILLAHGAGATIYKKDFGRASMVVPVEEVPHPSGRLRSGQLESDRPGRSFDRMGGARHALATHESASEHDAHLFALDLVARLERLRMEQHIHQLVLIAPPKLLGIVREAASEPLRSCMNAALAKDLPRADAEQVGMYLDALEVN